MAKFCEDIVCGKKYIRKSEKNELVCRFNENEEQLMPICVEFDAVMTNNGDIHIAAVDEKRNLVYIKNREQRWGRGVIAENAAVENVFIFVDDEKIKFCYVSEGILFELNVDNEIHSPVRINTVENSLLTFVDGNEVYYVNKNQEVVSTLKGVIYSGKNISFLFVSGNSVCVKDEKELKLIDVANSNQCKSLTRRHEIGAGCPVFVNKNEDKTLFWIDGKKLYSAKKQGEAWQRLESENVDAFDKVAIFKFCNGVSNVYTIGCVKKNKPERWGESLERNNGEFAEADSDSVVGKSGIMENFHKRLNMEIIMNEIREMHKKILEIDKKIEKIKKNHALQIISGVSQTKKQTNLSNLHKK